ncbi:MAG: hypothetical protein AAFW81_11380 [Pseudomonadota bacterium]
MKHATPETIASMAPFIDKIRALSDLVEKRPGVFYRKSRAFLHFHEHGDELYADVRFKGPDFERVPATSRKEQAALLSRLRESLRGEA